jgi:CubicO group peptidase (beta-lactamase class C family)
VHGYVVILVAAAAIACGRDATPTSPSPVPPAPTVVVPATPVDLKTSLSTAFDAFSIPANYGCSISISQHGQVLLERGRGQSAPGQPASGDSRYRIASLTKPITATAVLISERAGRLNRNDKINRFLTFAEPAPTIDELIKHVPGLPDYLATPAYQNGRTSPTSVETLLSLIQPWDGVRRNQYSNSHAILSGAALQKVNGLPYEQVVQRDIFGPAGMSQSSFAPPASESFPFGPTHPSWNYAAGGVTSTAADMNRFNQALLSDLFGFGAPQSFDRNAGVTSFGMGSGSPSGDLRFTHSGLVDEYASFTVLFPGDRASVVVLCNFPSISLANFVLGPNGIRSIMLAAR